MISDPKYYEEKIGRIKNRSLNTSLLNTFFCICNLGQDHALRFFVCPYIMQGTQQAQQTTEFN